MTESRDVQLTDQVYTVTRSLSSDVDLMTPYNLSNNRSPTFATSSGILLGSVKVLRMLPHVTNVQLIAIHQCYTIGEYFDDTTQWMSISEEASCVNITSGFSTNDDAGFVSVCAKVTISQIVWISSNGKLGKLSVRTQTDCQ